MKKPYKKYEGKPYKIYLLGLPNYGPKPHESGTGYGWINVLFDLMEDEGLPRPKFMDLRGWERNGIEIFGETYKPKDYEHEMNIYLKLASIANDHERKKVVILFGALYQYRWKQVFNDHPNVLILQRSTPRNNKPAPFFRLACKYLGCSTNIWRI